MEDGLKAGGFDGVLQGRISCGVGSEPTPSLRPLRTVDATGRRAGLDDLVVTLRREALASDHDPFDDAMVAAVAGLAEALKAETDALADAEARLGRLARKP